MKRKSSRNAKPLRAVRGNARLRNESFLLGDIILKRMTIPNGSLSTTAGGIVAVTTFSNSLVQSTPATEFASFAARYQQFRIKSFAIRSVPTFPVNSGMTAITGHNALYVSDFLGSAVPATAAQILADERCVVNSTARNWIFTVTSKRNPNALLWNPTSAAIPVANQMSIALASSTTATMPVSAIIGILDFEWIVELRGAQ